MRNTKPTYPWLHSEVSLQQIKFSFNESNTLTRHYQRADKMAQQVKVAALQAHGPGNQVKVEGENPPYEVFL